MRPLPSVAFAMAASSAVVVAVAAPAAAATRLSTHASKTTVGVDEPFVVSVTAMSEDGERPERPALKVPRGMTQEGPAISQRTQVQFQNGVSRTLSGITASWTLRAKGTGKYLVGPGSFEVNGQRQEGQVVTVTVVNDPSSPGQGQGPAAALDPIDQLFKSLRSGRFPRGLLDDDDDPLDLGFDPDTLPPAPDYLKVDQAPDPFAFVRLRTTPRRVVVGQQVTLDVLAYGSRGPFNDGTGYKAPRATDFLSFTIEHPRRRIHRLAIGGDAWWARRTNQVALFPLRTGVLPVEPATVEFEGSYYRLRSGDQVIRTSQGITVEVVEPPVNGRPAGYTLGDVGHYRLKATVRPRKVEAGESISVLIKLRGQGNLPSKLRLPEQPGIEWLEPTVTSDIGPSGTTVGGSRTFNYVVRLDRPGDIDLGDVTLPHWDPKAERYVTARASLGTVAVSGTAVAKDDAVSGNPFSELGTPRSTLEPVARPAPAWSSTPWYFAWLLAGPLGVLALGLIRDAGVHVAGRWRAKRSGAGSRAERAVSEARSALASDDMKAATAALERAIMLAIEGATDIKARGVLRSDLAPTLIAAGVDDALAHGVVKTLDDLDSVRFAGADHQALEALTVTVGEHVRALAKVRRRSRKDPS